MSDSHPGRVKVFFRGIHRHVENLCAVLYRELLQVAQNKHSTKMRGQQVDGFPNVVTEIFRGKLAGR